MCYGDDARPPLPPIRGAAGNQTDLKLQSDDGNRFDAFAVRTDSSSGRGMVILPDVRGLHSFYKELAVRFAEAGFDSIAIDYFGRTAQTSARDEEFDFMPHVGQTTPEGIELDVKAAIGYLRSPDGGSPAAIFTVGFCFGGTNSWRQSAHGHGLAGCIGFYGGRPLDRVGPWIPKMQVPILMLLAGDDHATNPEEFGEFARRVREQGVGAESHSYKGCPHSFFDRQQVQYTEASDDAWRRMLEFSERLIPPVPAGT
jgi:carboxymethylenebutenolidase